MEIKHVRAVLAVAEHLSFSMAAEELAFTTSAISKQVMALEKELDVRLFERNCSSKVTLTPEGEKLLPFFREIQKNYEFVLESVAELKKQAEPPLNFSYPQAIGNFGEDRFIEAFYDKYPGIAVKLHSAVGHDLVKKMVLGKIDICLFMNVNDHFAELVRECQFSLDLFNCISLGDCPLLLAISKSHPLAGLKSVKLQDFKNETFLFKKYFPRMEQAQGIRNFIKVCRSSGFEPRIRITEEQKISLMFLEAARGNVVIPLLSPPNVDYKGVAIVTVENVEPYAQKQMYYLKSNKSPTLAKFIRCVRELLSSESLITHH